MSFQTKPNLIYDIKYHSFVITNGGRYVYIVTRVFTSCFFLFIIEKRIVEHLTKSFVSVVWKTSLCRAPDENIPEVI